MKKIMLVFGTRPEAIKMCPLVKEFQRHPDIFETRVCVTGQHREMLDQVLTIFDVHPDYDLNIMKQGQDLYDVTARVLTGMREVLDKAQPDVVLVHGDTTTSMAAALAAFYRQIPVGHVEAGLRTHNLYSPWPEEMNRQVTGRIATYHFAPTPLSRQNLLDEGVAEEKITVTGNTVIDALQWVVENVLRKGYRPTDPSVASLLQDDKRERQDDTCHSERSEESPRRMVLITGHRRENFGEGFRNICHAIKELAERYPEVDFVYPMHLNPNVRKPIQEIFGGRSFAGAQDDKVGAQDDRAGAQDDKVGTQGDKAGGQEDNLHFIEPLDYLDFVCLMERSTLVLTDSGGIQEEAPGLGKPVLVMRDTTERPEALEAGTVRLVGTDRGLIVREVSRLLDDPAHYAAMSQAINPYGDGKACKRIVEKLK